MIEEMYSLSDPEFASAIFDTEAEALKLAAIAPGEVMCRCSQDGHNYFYWKWVGPLPAEAVLISRGEYHDSYEFKGYKLSNKRPTTTTQRARYGLPI